MKTYPLFPERKMLSLDGLWSFRWLGKEITLADFDPAQITEYDEKAAVPGVFDMGIDRYCQRGLGIYRTVIAAKDLDKENLRLRIGGLGLAARIFFDGQEIGQANMPYLPVILDFVRMQKERDHELVIAVDNRFEAQPYQFFRDFYDFYGFGGIYRSVTLSQLPDGGSIDRVQVFTGDLATGRVLLRILTKGLDDGPHAFTISFDNGTSDTAELPVENNCAEIELPVPDFRIWSPEDPALHLVNVTYNGDTIVERFGIRTIEAHDHKIYLNGKELYLDGANRHETHPQTGPVQTVQSMLEDIKLFKQAGMNFIRSVHYPQDQVWLDLCDETGMLLWVESLGWNLSEKDVCPETADRFLEQNRGMIRDGINHPSVLIWGMLNECASQKEESRETYALLLKDMKKEDPSRLRSFASCRNIYDVCLDEVDVISMNCYPGWFQDITDSQTLASDLIAPHLKAIADFYSQDQFGGKPIFISEIGACGLYGVRDRNFAQWSEDFQADYMVGAVKAIHKDDRFCGYALWQFCDSRSYQRGQIRGKPRGYNCAGLVDEYRRPKLAYDQLSEYLNSRKKG